VTKDESEEENLGHPEQSEPKDEAESREEPAEEPQAEEPPEEEVHEPTAQELADELDIPEEEEAEAPQEEPKEEPQPEAPKPEEKEEPVQVGGKPLPKGLYDEVPEEKKKEEPKQEEEAQPEQEYQAPENKELAEDEKALQALMAEGEEEEAEEERKRQEAEERDRRADANRKPLEEILADPRFDEFTLMQKKLFAATANQRNLYSELKNALLTFKKVKCKESNAGDSFRQGGRLIARITLNNDTLRLHLCLNPSQYNPRQYHHYSLEKYAAYHEVPFTLDVGDEEQLHIALGLINEAMSSKYLLYVDNKREPVDYAALYTLGEDGSIPEQPKPQEEEEEE
ncbi:MAG: hypothetical protein J5755_04225, partial [Clostridia bacterium]|nr:hypothetical protein [Clostridia bacterium]